MSLLASVTPGYFSTLRIALLEGRDFSKQDTARAPKVCIISAPMARRFWPAQDPLGYRVKLGGGTDAVPAEIVGVVAETRGYQAAPEGFEVYVPYPQMPSVENSLVLRTASDPLGLAAAVRAQVWALDGDQPVAEVATLEQALSESFQEPRLQAVLLSAFAALALILALVGIYGVVSYTLRQRTHEIGVRMALGAESAHILRMVIKEALALTLVGLAVGLTVALGLVRLLRSVLYVAPTGAADLLSYGNRGFFYGLKPTDPAVFVLVLSILAGVALLAAYLPARRASTVDPMVALRQE
jgi:putative ABC transport system permease protein